MIFMNKIKPLGIVINNFIFNDYLISLRKQLMLENFKIYFNSYIYKAASELNQKGIKYLVLLVDKEFEQKRILELNLPTFSILEFNIEPVEFAKKLEDNLNFLDLCTNDRGIGYTDIYYTSEFKDIIYRIDRTTLNVSLIRQLDI
ncbi:MAG TPA: hypothetical protein PLI27_02100 [Ignavibacteriales bacterium]|nr:hypothetical protein [Ignavibacteriales bacterium]HPD66857.1 hypothetical protein [Ignavibacteriales bacterium]HRR18636.1 hypothetical protein [Ignavibacteriales bacterium]